MSKENYTDLEISREAMLRAAQACNDAVIELESYNIELNEHIEGKTRTENYDGWTALSGRLRELAQAIPVEVAESTDVGYNVRKVILNLINVTIYTYILAWIDFKEDLECGPTCDNNEMWAHLTDVRDEFLMAQKKLETSKHNLLCAVTDPIQRNVPLYSPSDLIAGKPHY